METGKKSRLPKKVARKVAKAVKNDTAATVKKVGRVFSHAKESFKLLEALSAEKTRRASITLISGVRKLGIGGQTFNRELAHIEEIATLRTEFAALKDRMDEIEIQLSTLLGQSRREHSFVKSAIAEPLPRA